MAGVNISNVGTTYLHILDGAVETLNNASRARNKVTQNYEWRGSHLEGRLHSARNTAVGFLSDGSVFPVADKEDFVAYKVGRKMVGGQIQLTDGVMATAQKSQEVAVDVVSSHTEGLMKAILKMENFAFSRDGTGKIGTVKAVANLAATSFKVDDARAIWDKAVVDLYDSTGVTLKCSATVTSVASAPDSNGYFTVSCAALGSALVAGDLVYWSGANGIAYTGLDALVDNSANTFQSVVISSVPRYTSMVLSNGGTLRDLEPALFRQLQAGIYQKTGNDLPVSGLSCLASAWQLTNLDELYESALRISSDSSVGGVSMPSFQSSLGKVTIEVDSDAPYNKIFLVDYSQIFRGVQKKLGWRMEGGQIFKRSDVAPIWTATAIEIAEMYIKSRSSSGKITDLNETVKTAY